MGLLVRQSRRIRRVVKCPNLMLYMVELHFGKKLQFHVGLNLERVIKMASKKKSVPLNSKEATDYLSKMLGIPVHYGSVSEEKKEGEINE